MTFPQPVAAAGAREWVRPGRSAGVTGTAFAWFWHMTWLQRLERWVAAVGRRVRATQGPSELLPEDENRRFARLLAVGGTITLCGCLGSASADVSIACPDGYVDLWKNGSVCVVDAAPCAGACGSGEVCVVVDDVGLCRHEVLERLP